MEREGRGRGQGHPQVWAVRDGASPHAHCRGDPGLLWPCVRRKLLLYPSEEKT